LIVVNTLENLSEVCKRETTLEQQEQDNFCILEKSHLGENHNLPLEIIPPRKNTDYRATRTLPTELPENKNHRRFFFPLVALLFGFFRQNFWMKCKQIVPLSPS